MGCGAGKLSGFMVMKVWADTAWASRTKTTLEDGGQVLKSSTLGFQL